MLDKKFCIIKTIKISMNTYFTYVCSLLLVSGFNMLGNCKPTYRSRTYATNSSEKLQKALQDLKSDARDKLLLYTI